MDTRPRILIVEDVENMRETWIAVFEHENFRVDGAANAEEAIQAAERSSYHVALVDIMLAGEKNTSNRDGVKVLKHLRDLREGTQAFVLSAQRRDLTLVRDLLKEYGAIDYIAKWDWEEQGDDIVIAKVKNAIDNSQLNKPPKWQDLYKALIIDDNESIFVSECLRTLGIKGGFENLSRSLIGACQHLLPLIGKSGVKNAISRDRVPEVFSGVYWSKGQGSAVELLLFGKSAPMDKVEKEWKFSEREPLYSHNKGDLSVVVLPRSDLARAEFSFASR